MLASGQCREQGFTLVELLIAMAISGVVLGALFTFFIQQRKYLAVQEQVTEMVESSRAAMDMMTREIRMAGYNPRGTAVAGIVLPTDTCTLTTCLNFTVDETGTDGTGGPDGLTDGPNENIRYKLYTPDDGIQKLGRRAGGDSGTNQPVAEQMRSLAFEHRDRAGTVTTTPANIRQVKITITARTAKPDLDYAGGICIDNICGYRTYTLTSFIKLRNVSN